MSWLCKLAPLYKLISRLYKLFMDKFKNLGIFIFTIFIVSVAIGTVTIVTVAVTRMLTGLCKCTTWSCFYIPNFIIPDNLIIFFWTLAVFIVGGALVFVSRYNEKKEKSREKAANKKEERRERMQRVFEYDKFPHPFTFSELTCSDIAVQPSINNAISDPEITYNLQHLCRNVIYVIKLRFSREYGNVKFDCVSGYRCKKINNQSKLEKKKNMLSEHENGEAVDIDISCDCCKSPVTLNKLFQFITDVNNCSDLPLNKVILVNSGKRQWIHISSSRIGENKREFYKLVEGKKEPI